MFEFRVALGQLPLAPKGVLAQNPRTTPSWRKVAITEIKKEGTKNINTGN
jgi:hypothetical protein